MGLSLVREDRDGRTSGVRVVVPTAALGSYVRKGETLNASKRETDPKMRIPVLTRKCEGLKTRRRLLR